jgi:hypothetical protein
MTVLLDPSLKWLKDELLFTANMRIRVGAFCIIHSQEYPYSMYSESVLKS